MQFINILNHELLFHRNFFLIICMILELIYLVYFLYNFSLLDKLKGFLDKLFGNRDTRVRRSPCREEDDLNKKSPEKSKK